MTDVACPSCGRPNPPGSRFCGACGGALERTCPSCGAVVPEGFRFCGACGTALEASAAPAAEDREERKVVTALFADLTASTEMASRLDPEDLRGVLRSFFDAMAEEIDRYGGTVEKFIGDAVVAVFGAPVAHEDDPERAVRCALAMHRRLGALNDDVAERAGGDLAMRIGVNTGEVIAHRVEEGIVTGEAVNVAARLQALAEPGTVVVGERTYRDTRSAFAFHDLGEVGVKGIERPLRVFRVDGELTAPRAGTAAEGPFVGREPELDLLRLLYERTVRERRPNLVTVVGPPGIGKSRLVREAVDALAPLGRARLVRGRCLPYGAGLTYWPLAEILKADCAILDSDPHAEILRKAHERLDVRFPGEERMGVTRVLLSSIGVDVPSDPLAGAEPAAARSLVQRAWQRYLESLTAEGPVLAVIEDVHWADPSLLELIEGVVARASGAALVLCTTRPDLFERRHAWAGGLSNATTISLSPLTASEGASLVGHLLGGDAPSEVVGPILHRSEGNPFFAGELVRMMVEDGTLARRDGRWALERELPSALPDTVQGVIASRIDLLPAAEKRAIQDAAVVGRMFWPGAVGALGGAGVTAALDGLVAKGLARERDASSIAGERELIFHHVLTRDVAYASIPRARRAEAHQSVGRWLESVTSGRAEEFAEVLAHHFDLAGDAERTARYALLAGNRHLRVFAAEPAIEWYDHALVVAEEGATPVRSRIALARGTAREQLGRFPEAREDYELALALAKGGKESELEARALAALAHVSWLSDRYDEGDAVLPAALEAARRVGAADVETRLLYTAGTMRFGRGAFDEALPLHEQALVAAERSGDVEGQALAHHGLCETYFFMGPFDLGLEHGRVADRLFTDLGQRPMVAHNAYMVSWFEWFAGDWDAARATGDASIEGCREVGNRRDESFAHIGSAELYLSVGDLGRALEEIDRSLEIARELELRRAEMIASAIRANVVSDMRDARVLAPDVHRALALSEELGGRFLRSLVVANAGLLATLEGDADEARRRFAEAREGTAAISLDVAWSTRVEVLAAEHAGDVARLEEAAERLGPLRDAPPLTLWGPYASALAAFLRGDHEGALRVAEPTVARASAARFERLRWRAARVAWLAATALGRTGEAAAHLETARVALAPFVASVPEDLRPAFVGRSDVAEIREAP